jgi:hypothetical protein
MIDGKPEGLLVLEKVTVPLWSAGERSPHGTAGCLAGVKAKVRCQRRACGRPLPGGLGREELETIRAVAMDM